MSFSTVPRRAPAAPTTSDSAPRRSGWGSSGGTSRQGEFDSAATAAFGKKPARMDAPSSAAPQTQWGKSAFQQLREAEAAKKAAPPPKTFEEFPALGGGARAASVVRVPKPVISVISEKKKTENTSFAALAANWAKADEEKRYLEALATQKRMEQQALQNYETATRLRFSQNLHTTRDYYARGDEYYEDDYENEYIEGELDNVECSAEDLRAEKRALQRRFEEYSDEDEDNY